MRCKFVICLAAFEADFMLASLVNEGTCDVVLSTDQDMLLLVDGPGIIINQFKVSTDVCSAIAKRRVEVLSTRTQQCLKNWPICYQRRAFTCALRSQLSLLFFRGATTKIRGSSKESAPKVLDELLLKTTIGPAHGADGLLTLRALANAAAQLLERGKVSGFQCGRSTTDALVHFQFLKI